MNNSKKFTTTTKEIELERGIKLIIARIGQMGVGDGDELEVAGLLGIAAETDAGGKECIVPAVRFNERLEIMGEALNYNWGSLTSAVSIDSGSTDAMTGYRHRGRRFSANKWRTAFELAEKYLRAEAGKLIALMDERERIVREGEDPDPEPCIPPETGSQND